MSQSPPPSPDPSGVDDRTRNRNRWALLGVIAVFVLPILVAMWIARVDRIPGATGVHGEMYDPPRDLREVAIEHADGSPYPWQPEERTWRIVVVAPADCDAACAALATELDKVWRLFGHRADRVDVLWACEQDACMPPDGTPRPDTFTAIRAGTALRAALPGVDDPDGTPVYVLDPNGFLVLRYAPGFDPAGLRADVAKLIRLV